MTETDESNLSTRTALTGRARSDAAEQTANDPRNRRLWRLTALMNRQLGAAVGYPEFAAAAAEVIRAEIGDGVAVALLEGNGAFSPIVVFAHKNAARRVRTHDMFARLGDDQLRSWIEDVGETTASVRGQLDRGPEREYVRVMRANAAEVVVVATAFAPLRGTDGTLRGLVMCTRDENSEEFSASDLDTLVRAADTVSLLLEVTSAREAERATNRYWSTAFDESPFGKIVLDSDRRYVRINPQACNILGVEQWSLLGKPWGALVDSHRDEDLADFERARMGVPSPPRVQQNSFPDGRVRWIQRSISAVFDSNGETELFHVQFVDVSDVHNLELAATQLAEQRRVLLSQLVSAEQDERTRIGQDVHDDAIQLLAAAQLRMHLLSNEIADNSNALQAADIVAELITTAQRRLRELLLDLEPPSSVNRPLDQALRDVAAIFFEQTTTEVLVTGELGSLPADVAAVFYRAARESLSNVRRHAQASHVSVELTEGADVWQICVADDGVGVPEVIVSEPGHLGMRGMYSRIEALGGTCTVSRRTSGGTEVRLLVPKS